MFKLKIETDNQAFEADGVYEIERILKQAARKLFEGRCIGTLQDINGNTVGTYELKE